MKTGFRAARARRVYSARWRREQAASALALLGNEPFLTRGRVRVVGLRVLLQTGEEIALLIALLLASGCLSVGGLFSLDRARAAFRISRRTPPSPRPPGPASPR